MRFATCFFIFVLGILIAMAQPDRFSMPLIGQNGEEVACSLQDVEGYWWYGGNGTGLCRFDGYETESFRSDRQNPDLLLSNDVLCMIEQTAHAEIWFGTKEGAYILNKKNYTVRPIVLKTQQEGNELADKRITCMVTASDGSVWLSYRNQLLHFSAKKELLERFETTWEGKNRSVMRLNFDTDSTLWAGLWNGGVICLKKVKGQWITEHKEWSEYPSDNNQSLTTEEHKLMLDSVMTQLAPTSDTTVLSWARRHDGHFFIGTYHSLYHYDGNQLTQLLTDLDKVRRMVYSERLQTLFLLSKARGVCKWKDNHLTVLLDSTQYRQLQLQGDTALLLSKGVANVSMFNLCTQTLTADTTTADVKPIATAYMLNGEKQLMGYGVKTLSLPSDVELVEIHLSTLDYANAEHVQFAWRLNNDDPWTELPEGEHVVLFTHLPAGTSQLHVRATDTFGRWSVPTTVLTLVRSAQWYEHTWLWWLLAVIILGGGYYLIRKMKKKEDPQESSSSSTLNLQPSTLTVAEQEFLEKAAAAVSAHLIDTDYSVDALASDLCMSRANLHRKMRSITGQTPTDFIRNQRLERAAHLLRTTSNSVNEISDLVGFSYPSYFTRCFKERFGVAPKDYR